MVRMFCALVLTGAVGMLCVSSNASALDIPGVKKAKKEVKEKSEDAQKAAGLKKEEEAKPANTQETGAAPAKASNDPAPAPAPKQEVGGGAVMPEQNSETTITKEAWEEYKKYKVGAFVEYSMPAGGKMRSEVTEVGADFIVIKQTTSGPQYSMVMKSKMIFKETTEKITVKGKEFNATRMDTSTNGQVVSRSWSSKEIPNLMGGLVKSEAQGQVSMELTDYSFGK